MILGIVLGNPLLMQAFVFYKWSFGAHKNANLNGELTPKKNVFLLSNFLV